MPTRPIAARTLVGLLVVAALVLAGCAAPKHQVAVPTASASVAPSPGLERFYAQTLSWSSCDDGLQCASVLVPLDYADPAGTTITIAIAKVAASGRSTGSVVTDPGGPGSSGVGFVASLAKEVGSDLRKNRDLIGIDPRGVGSSKPAISCLTDTQMDEQLAFDVDGSTQAGRDAAAALYTTLGQGCLKRTGDLLAHVDTVSAARDLDVLRAALGEDTLDYLGFSYGTELGATYAALFPTRVGKLVLDGALDPTLSSSDVAVGQAGGFESALRAFITDCEKATTCPLHGGVQGGLTQISRLLAGAHTHPIDTGTSRSLTASLTFTGIAMALYSRDYWTYLRAALSAVLSDGDGSQLLALADAYASRNDDGSYADNSMEAFWAISCADDRDDPDPVAMTAEADRVRAVAPTVWQFFSWGGLQCAGWPTPVAPRLASYAATGAPPILVVGTTNDPATPYAWAQSLATTLGVGVLLTRVGEGHTAYTSGNTCIQKNVDAFLLDGTVPATGTRC